MLQLVYSTYFIIYIASHHDFFQITHYKAAWLDFIFSTPGQIDPMTIDNEHRCCFSL